MTRYCVDPVRHELIATWGTGEGDLATRIATVPTGTDLAALSRLAGALTQLSTAAWRTYTHPASAADSLEVNSEGWRREEERKAFDEVTAAVTTPNLPQGGSMIVEYSPVLENAHRVGRALIALDIPDLTEAIRAETTVELAAVESAELGDLTGRAQQAVLLSREGASPAQVSAADRLLQEDPFGPAALYSDIDPTAAAVAAAHWLYAAAEAVSEASGYAPTEVIREADNIEALPHATPTLVLELLDNGVSPYDAVTGLVRHAMRVADGVLPDPAAVREQLDEDEEMIIEYDDDSEEADDVLTGIRLTPLDPRRPAHDLLEDLLTGINGCWLLHQEYAEDEDRDDDEEESDDETAERHQHHSRAQFAALVRAIAADNRDRLV
ncbi:hypothetical protein ACIG0C_09625 [Kitasatospora aureofaciens]|uniref:Uncharacterized protein n=1 Tax=Kitasatospora aureofaciens TaxID=1894 RepID=A0A8H9LHN7_KITAU|nr:hypothetical protein [Kitasatospora aureofaciens]UKZ09334.1 hypothetical protein BOQ63_036015 [Streptomyces viridifaciens]GGU56107.1 hypothetical protein GCM10010502_03010 [Kitasatospora aureofaciens]